MTYDELLADRDEWKQQHENLLAMFIAAEASVVMLREALKLLHDNTAEYITINHLGQPHQNQDMRMARDALSATADQVAAILEARIAERFEKVDFIGFGGALQYTGHDLAAAPALGTELFARKGK